MIDVLHNGKTPVSTSTKSSTDLGIHEAVYGDLNGDPSRQVEVTKTLKKRATNHSLHAIADNKLAGRDPAFKTKKQLRVVYSLGGEQSTIVVNENEMLQLGSELKPDTTSPQPATLSISKKGIVLTAMKAGAYELIYSDGTHHSVQIPSIPKPIDLSTDWNLKCPKGRGRPK